ncbi:class A beta-lactamase-related serine hydrolase [Pseudomonas sp. KSR10]|uniref:serine hydrolase n=1 Tax=Pseudomonas sp. KSR10 TaxID=2916654 RepID=UPI001EF76175|nr:serine hydrolase [Pseudomonas sp. KSR10]MCG6542065.1 class A beta-lactamase-related serine hydrolase [Pseudomonas sp. KSR10]
MTSVALGNGKLLALPVLIGLGIALWAYREQAYSDSWRNELEQDVRRIDEGSPGRLGLYVKHLGDGTAFVYEADRFWYLGSAVKVPIAVAVLQGVDEGEHSLDDELALEASDKVDGSGDLVWQDNGVAYSVRTLLNEMLIESDNTAANMLIRLVGEDRLNERTHENMGGKGFERITDFTQVRRDVYGELHPDARELDNLELVKLASAPFSQPRYEAVARVLNRSPDELEADSMEQAYERYYARKLNSSTLEAYGTLLEKLVSGELLSESSRDLLFKNMKLDRYDAYRLEAGLPRDVPFIQKTGTQLERACHVGVIDPLSEDQTNTVIVVACAEAMDEDKEAGAAFEQLGQAITQALLGKPE